MPQNEYMERWEKLHGKRFDAAERKRKREAREAHQMSAKAQNLKGLRAKQFAEKRYGFEGNTLRTFADSL